MNIKLIREKTYRAILGFAIPSVIAMVFTSLATLVDGFFVGRFIDPRALAGIQLGLPMLYFYLGIAIMIGVGGVTIVGKYLGMKNIAKAKDVFMQTIVITIIIVSIITCIIAIIFPLVLPKLNIESYLVNYVNDYYKIMIFSYAVTMIFIVLGMFIRVAGKPQLFMIISLINNIINIILDYTFIVKLNYGIKGAAYASLISTTVGVVLACYILKKHSPFEMMKINIDVKLIKQMLLNGSSELIGQWSMMFTTFLFNAVVMYKVGDKGITATTIAGYSGYIFSMIAVGVGQGVSPMISYVYGDGDVDLCKKLRKKGSNIVFMAGVVMTLIIWIFAYNYISFFAKDLALIKIVEKGIRIYSIGFVFAGFNIIASFAYTALGMAKESAIISASRGLIVISILIVALPLLFGFNGVWFIFPFTEIITVLLTIRLREKEVLVK